MLEHFFDHYNPQDEIIINSPLFKEKLDEYMELVLHAARRGDAPDEMYIIEALDNFLIHFADNENLIDESLTYIWDKIHNLGLDLVAEHLDINYLARQCDAEENLDLQKRLEAYERLSIGKEAPEITWTQGTELKKLSAQNYDQFLIIFWASWCGHCEEVLPEIHQYLLDNNKILIVTIALDEDEQLWKEAAENYTGWTHIRAAEKWGNEFVEDYGCRLCHSNHVFTR